MSFHGLGQELSDLEQPFSRDIALDTTKGEFKLLHNQKNYRLFELDHLLGQTQGRLYKAVLLKGDKDNFDLVEHFIDSKTNVADSSVKRFQRGELTSYTSCKSTYTDFGSSDIYSLKLCTTITPQFCQKLDASKLNLMVMQGKLIQCQKEANEFIDKLKNLYSDPEHQLNSKNNQNLLASEFLKQTPSRVSIVREPTKVEKNYFFGLFSHTVTEVQEATQVKEKSISSTPNLDHKILETIKKDIDHQIFTLAHRFQLSVALCQQLQGQKSPPRLKSQPLKSKNTSIQAD